MQVIIFDLDDTLYNQLEVFERAYKKIFSNTKIDIKKLFLKTRYYGDKKLKSLQEKEITQEDYYIYRIEKAFNSLGVKVTKEKCLLLQKEYKKEQQNIKLSSEIVKLLDYLSSKKITLALMTNGKEKYQKEKIKTLGLSRWIKEENIFISGSIGYDKPSVEIFNYAKDKLKVKKEEMLFVGDTPTSDVLGCNKAEIKIIWFNRQETLLPKTLKVFKEVRREEKLFLALKNIIEDRE